jgi:hypothetical protein
VLLIVSSAYFDGSQQQAIAACQKDAMRAHPNVSIFTIGGACHRATTGRPTMT